MKVVIAIADVPNLNNRVYSHAALEHVCATYANRECFGMLGMPECPPVAPTPESAEEDPDTFLSGMTVPPDRVSHTVTNLRMEDGKLVGDVAVLSTPMGVIVRQLLDENVPLQFRTAGIGNFNRVGDHIEVTDFHLASINAVKDGA